MSVAATAAAPAAGMTVEQAIEKHVELVIGISTDKLHARGPMGVADLTTYKWVVYGNGTIRE